ncbi:energy transducer TonB [Collimonas sp.]|jgi:TonB family protein|uniref:energy transducer TonB n=1 Tax=Collimonas sp. TaxID=1963772 RepID=UPI002C14538D|nr:energy transducer TonB [Collimonas sp.]HWW99398.1 energy transducer TonB [Collimonas sp.]
MPFLPLNRDLKRLRRQASLICIMGFGLLATGCSSPKQNVDPIAPKAAVAGAGGSVVSAVNPPVVTTYASPRLASAAKPGVTQAVASRNVVAPAANIPRDTPPSVVASSCQAPDYPRSSRQNEEQGTVGARLTVGSNGHVLDITLEKSSGFTALDKSAMQAWALCQFVPAMRDGAPVQSETRIQYAWKLDGVALQPPAAAPAAKSASAETWH